MPDWSVIYMYLILTCNFVDFYLIQHKFVFDLKNSHSRLNLSEVLSGFTVLIILEKFQNLQKA